MARQRAGRHPISDLRYPLRAGETCGIEREAYPDWFHAIRAVREFVVALRRGFKTWCESAARGYRREPKLSATSPLDPRILAKHLNIDIWRPVEVPGLDPKTIYHLTVVASDSWSAATLRHNETNLIIINDSHSLTRQNNSLAHEIGHVVLRHEPAKMYVTPDGFMMMSEYDPAQEDEATWFAGAILVPRDALLDLVRRGISDAAAASHFGVSISLLRMRRGLTGVDIQLSRRRGTWAP